MERVVDDLSGGEEGNREVLANMGEVGGRRKKLSL